MESAAPSGVVAVALNRAASGMFLAAVCQVLVGMVFAWSSYPWVFWLVRFPAFLSVFLLLLGALMTEPHRVWVPALCLLVAAFTLTASAALAGVDTGAANVAEPLVGLGAFGAGMSQDPWARPAALAMIAVHRGGLYLAGAGLPREHLTFLLLECGSFTAAVAGSAVARHLARPLDAVEAELATAAQADARRRVDLRRQLERSTELHDVAALTLTLLGQGVVRDSDELRVRCRDEAALLRGERAAPTRSRDLAVRLRDVARRFAEQGLAVRLDLADRLPAIDVPDVVDALAGAVRAALGNVLLHSEVVTVGVTAVPHGPDGVRVVVTDGGVGFRTAGTRGGMGLAVSIVERMQDVRGWAGVVSVPGRGTTVTLQWPAI